MTAHNEPVSKSELPGYGLIQVDGTDASAFLQGQLSANIDIMQQGETVWAAHCNPKGRIIANFFIYRHGDNRFLLLLPTVNIPVAIQNLQKYAVFFQGQCREGFGQLRAFWIDHSGIGAGGIS